MRLDATEYLHLALRAINTDDHHAALQYLTNALELEPNHAIAHYLLAAEHAELGLLERAASGMVQALQLAPNLDIAHFQLGLLYLQLNRLEDAKVVFSNLLGVTNNHALTAFAHAFIAIINNNQAEAIHYLNQGIGVCDENPALKNDMTRVMKNLTAKTDDAINTTPQTSISVEESTTVKTEAMAVFLGAYRDSLEKL